MFAPESNKDQKQHRSALVRILQMAYSGERAAAFAYQGHWRSVSNTAQRRTIQRIEQEEWSHRADVGQMLLSLNEKPVWWRELLMATIGRTVAVGCFLIGWFLPMYLAGQLETNNVDEYDVAADHATALGLSKMSYALREMAQKEKEHEIYFAALVEHHPWLHVANHVFGWHPELILQRNNHAGHWLPTSLSIADGTILVPSTVTLPNNYAASKSTRC